MPDPRASRHGAHIRLTRIFCQAQASQESLYQSPPLASHSLAVSGGRCMWGGGVLLSLFGVDLCSQGLLCADRSPAHRLCGCLGHHCSEIFLFWHFVGSGRFRGYPSLASTAVTIGLWSLGRGPKLFITVRSFSYRTLWSWVRSLALGLFCAPATASSLEADSCSSAPCGRSHCRGDFRLRGQSMGLL